LKNIKLVIIENLMSAMIEQKESNKCTIRSGSATDIGCGHQNQDRSFTYTSPDGQTNFFGVLDGHSRLNGEDASILAKDYCEVFIPANYELFLADSHEFIKQLFTGAEEAIKDGFKRKYPGSIEIDYTLSEANGKSIPGGSTFTLLIIHQERVIVANVGDSSVISCTLGKEARVLEADHSPQNIFEYKRIMSADPSILFKYDGPRAQPDIFRPNPETSEPEITNLVQYHKNVRKEAATLVSSQDGMCKLAFTRSLADFGLKPGVTAEPDINEYSLNELFGGDSLGAFVLASDGLWDNWLYEDVSKFVMDDSCLGALVTEDGVQRVTDSLMQRNLVYANRNFPGQGDNVTITVIFVNLK
jgi:serine/threonine protein phosphatase PrpC